MLRTDGIKNFIVKKKGREIASISTMKSTIEWVALAQTHKHKNILINRAFRTCFNNLLLQQTKDKTNIPEFIFDHIVAHSPFVQSLSQPKLKFSSTSLQTLERSIWVYKPRYHYYPPPNPTNHCWHGTAYRVSQVYWNYLPTVDSVPSIRCSSPIFFSLFQETGRLALSKCCHRLQF